MIKLIASDVDGTLIQGKNLSDPDDVYAPSDKAFSLIRECIDRGIVFVVASGRQYENLKRMFGSVWRDLYFIADNGHVVVYKDNINHKVVMPNELAQQVIDFVIDTPHCEILVSTPNSVYVLDDKEKRWFNDIVFYDAKYTAALIEDYKLLKYDDIIKVSAYVEDGYLDQIADKFEKRWGDLLQVTKSGNGWIDLGISGKDAALRNLMDSLSIKKEEVLVFGDNQNDMEMLASVPHSYAMSGATDEVKGSASYIANSVEEVVEHYLKTGEIKK